MKPIYDDSVLSKVNFDILYMNIQCLRNKLDNLNHILSKHKYNVLCFSEHWLNNYEITLYNPDGYVLGNYYSRVKHIHGGTIIYTKNDVNVEVIDMTRICDELNFEVTGVIIHSFKVIILTIYRSPDGDFSNFIEKLDSLLNSLIDFKYELLVFGGFNVDFLVNSVNTFNLCNVFRMYGCFCTVDQPTRGKTCLDNMFTTINKSLYNVSVYDLGFSDHRAIISNINIEMNLTSSQGQSYILRRKLNYYTLDIYKQVLATIDWSLLLSSIADSQYSLFDSFYDIFCNYFPVDKIKTCRRISPNGITKINWYTDELASLKNEIMAVRTIVAATDDYFKTILHNLNSKYKAKIKEEQLKANVSFIENSSNKSKALWSVIKSSSSFICKEDISISANDFNDFFTEQPAKVKGRLSQVDVSSMEFLSNSYRIDK